LSKSPDAFRTISEVADDLDLPQHVLRFWETRFTQIKPMKRGGGRRYYRPEDVELLRGIRHLLYGEGYTIRGVQRILKEQGPRSIIAVGRGESRPAPPDPADAEPAAEQPPRRVEPFLPPERPVRPSVRMDEIEPDDREPDDVPIYAPPRRPVAVADESREPRHAASLAAADTDRLRSVLADLLECKRILDQAR